MRILHIGWGYSPTFDGCGPVVYVHTLARAQQQAGHQVVVAGASERSLPGKGAYAIEWTVVDGIPYALIGNRPTYMHDFWNPRREAENSDCRRACRRLFSVVAPDVIHIHNVIGLSFDVIWAAKLSGARVIMSLHNYFPVCSRDDLFFADAERCEGPTIRSCSRCLGTMIGDEVYRQRLRSAVAALNACDVLLPVSSRVADIYARQGVEGDRMHVERIGSLAAERLWDAIGRERGSEHQPSDPLRAVFFGSLAARKGVMILLQALKYLPRPEAVEIHVLGNPGTKEARDIQAFLATCPPRAASRIHFDGPFTQQSLVTALGQMDVAVLTPRWEDNGPQTVLEALAAGLPIVGTKVGGLVDFVQDGINGRLVEEGDSRALALVLDELSSDRAIVKRMRDNISPPRSMEEHCRVLDNLYVKRGERESGSMAPPVVSVVLYVANGIASTYRCLERLAQEFPQSATFEIIVIDDATSDGTERLLSQLQGDVRVLRNESRVGFEAACQQGAAIARGRQLLFLTPVTAFEPRWLEELFAAECSANSVDNTAMLLRSDDRALIPHSGEIWPAIIVDRASYQKYGGIHGLTSWTESSGSLPMRSIRLPLRTGFFASADRPAAAAGGSL